jgi:hypothetical protein
VIYKGRIDVDKLPAVGPHKKASSLLLAPPPEPHKSNLDSHLIPIHQQHQRDLSDDNQERNGLSSLVPNLEPALPREESFT